MSDDKPMPGHVGWSPDFQSAREQLTEQLRLANVDAAQNEAEANDLRAENESLRARLAEAEVAIRDIDEYMERHDRDDLAFQTVHDMVKDALRAVLPGAKDEAKETERERFIAVCAHALGQFLRGQYSEAWAMSLLVDAYDGKPVALPEADIGAQ